MEQNYQKERATGGGGKISNIYLRCLEFLIFFGVMVDARPEPTYEEKMRVPPLVHPKKISGISSTPKIFEILATLKNISYSVH